MCDFDNDFGDDFDDGFEDEGFMDEDSFGEAPDDLSDDLDDTDDGFISDDREFDKFTTRDAFFIGSIIGNAYEEAMDELRRMELMKKKRFNRRSGFD